MRWRGSARVMVTFSPDDRRRDQESAGLDSVRNHGVLGAMQFPHPLDDDPSRARAFDFRAHRDEKIGEILDFGLFGGSVDDRRPFGKHGSHHHIVGAEHRRAEPAAQIDCRPLKFRSEHFHVAALHAHGGAKRFKAAQVQIDRPIANDASARQRDRRLLFPSEQRAEDADRGAHLPHDIIGGFVRTLSALTVTVPLARSTSQPSSLRIVSM